MLRVVVLLLSKLCMTKIKIREGELPIWPTINDKKEKDTDGEPGLHIVEMVQFAKADWVAEANHGLRKDFEDKTVLFPYFDSATLGLAISDDKLKNRLYDTRYIRNTVHHENFERYMFGIPRRMLGIPRRMFGTPRRMFWNTRTLFCNINTYNTYTKYAYIVHT